MSSHASTPASSETSSEMRSYPVSLTAKKTSMQPESARPHVSFPLTRATQEKTCIGNQMRSTATAPSSAPALPPPVERTARIAAVSICQPRPSLHHPTSPHAITTTTNSSPCCALNITSHRSWSTFKHIVLLPFSFSFLFFTVFSTITTIPFFFSLVPCLFLLFSDLPRSLTHSLTRSLIVSSLPTCHLSLFFFFFSLDIHITGKRRK